jgi:hypothetical protein
MGKPEEPEHWRDAVLRILLPKISSTDCPPVFPVRITIRDAAGKAFRATFQQPDGPAGRP